jgi:hypothetical protein
MPNISKEETLKLALEALHGFIPYLPIESDKQQCDRYDNAISAIKQSLTHPAPFTPIDADMVTDEMAIDYFKDYPYMKDEPDSLICAKRCIAAAVNAYMGAKK